MKNIIIQSKYVIIWKNLVFLKCVLVCVFLCVCVYIYIHTHTHTHTAGSRFATVCFTTIHFYDPCPVGPSTPDLWCITVANQASFLYLVHFWLFPGVHVFLLFLFWCSSFKLTDFSTHDVHKQDRREGKIKTVAVTFFLDVFWTTAWAFFNKIKSDLINIFFNYLCNFLYT